MDSHPPFKKRRKGGLRQRLAREGNSLESLEDTSQGQEAAASSSSSSSAHAPAPSRLVQNLLKDFAWGGMSAQKLQDICRSSVEDLNSLKKLANGSQAWTTHPIEMDQKAVASIGVSGQYSSKCYSDLMKKVEANIALPLPHRERMRFAQPLGEQVQEFLLPHDMFAAFFKCKATWNKVILPNNDLPQKFWEAQQGHPQWQGHPLSTMNPNQLKKMIPLSLHGDEVPITGIGKQWARKMVNFSWHSLLSTIASVRDSQFFIWALFEKVGLIEEEVDGYNTLWHFFKVLAWSFEFLFKGIYPTHDVNGRKQLGSNDEEGITKQVSCFLVIMLVMECFSRVAVVERFYFICSLSRVF